MSDLRATHVDLPLSLLRPGDVYEGGGGAHRESILVETVELLAPIDHDGPRRVRYTGKCRGSRGKPVAWSGFVDEKVYVTVRGPGATFEEMDAGIRFDPDGKVVLSDSAPRPGEAVDETTYQAYLDRQAIR